MKRKQNQKGITLVALIITIIVLLILAVIAIREVTGNGIIAYSKDAKEKAHVAQDKEAILLALNEWKIVSATGNQTFENFMQTKFGANKVEPGDSADEVIVTLENGNQYKVKADGTIEATKGISISSTTLTLILAREETKKAELTATLSGITGEISWSIPETDASKVTLNSTTGETITVTGVTVGETTITVSCGSYSKTCKITVLEKLDHSEVVVPTVSKTGIYASSPNIKEVRKGVKADIPIPVGFTYIKGDDIGGAVISDQVNAEGESTGSEFVWIPVGNINDMVMCQTHGASVTLDITTLQCPNCGANTKLAGKLYATSTGNNFNASLAGQTYPVSNGLREPRKLTFSSSADNASKFAGTNVTWTETLYEDSFKKMAESVDKYKGFYIGRYEMSYDESAKSVAGVKSAINDSDANNWWGLYAKAKTYTRGSVESEMIWGSQYDAMMRWMAGNNINVTSTTPTDLSIGKTVKNSNSDRITGSQPKDKLSNIFDLLGNSYEWTQEAGEYNRIFRGGCYVGSDAPSYRYGMGPTAHNEWPNGTYYGFSSRMQLYVK